MNSRPPSTTTVQAGACRQTARAGAEPPVRAACQACQPCAPSPEAARTAASTRRKPAAMHATTLSRRDVRKSGCLRARLDREPVPDPHYSTKAAVAAHPRCAGLAGECSHPCAWRNVVQAASSSTEAPTRETRSAPFSPVASTPALCTAHIGSTTASGPNLPDAPAARPWPRCASRSRFASARSRPTPGWCRSCVRVLRLRARQRPAPSPRTCATSTRL